MDSVHPSPSICLEAFHLSILALVMDSALERYIAEKSCFQGTHCCAKQAGWQNNNKSHKRHHLVSDVVNLWLKDRSARRSVLMKKSSRARLAIRVAIVKLTIFRYKNDFYLVKYRCSRFAEICSPQIT